MPVDSGTAQIQATIADEIARTDLGAQIASAVQSAIRHYERMRFYFNEVSGKTFNTVVGQEYYTATDLADIPNIISVDSAMITVNGTQYCLKERSISWFDENSSPICVGDTTDFGFYAQKLQVYPIPNAVRTITLAYHKKFDTKAGSTDSNPWTTEAEELIRTSAKRRLYAHIIRDAEMAGVMAGIEAELLAGIRAETAERSFAGGITPHGF